MVRERNTAPVVFDATPKQQPVDLDEIINDELKLELARASIILEYHRIKPLRFKMICTACDVDDLDLIDWAKDITNVSNANPRTPSSP